MLVTRRDIYILLPLMTALGVRGFGEKPAATDGAILKSAVYNCGELAADRDDGDTYIPVFEGSTRTGIHIKLHETELAPGAVAHLPHRHAGEEIFMVQEGILEIEINGVDFHSGPCSVAYVASNVEHAIRNSSNAGTRYFVLLLGSSH